MSRRRALSFRAWGVVIALLLAIDVLLFRVGFLWRLTPDFGKGLRGENWGMLYQAARAFESEPAVPGTVAMVGSSVVLYGTDPVAIDAHLARDGIPAHVARFGTHGSSATDSTILLWSARTMRPWLAIYGVAARDFPKTGATDTSIARTFYDVSLDLPALPRTTLDAKLDAVMKRQWKLYRYRFFARTALETSAARWVRRLGLPAAAQAGETPAAPPPIPPEALRYFPRTRLTPGSWQAWDRWRQSRQFSDFLGWMTFGGGMVAAQYKRQTLANFGTHRNPQADAVPVLLANLKREGIRVVLLYFPENPIFRAPEAREYFDPALSDRYARFLREMAATHDARFEDLRHFLEPEDFYDLNHPNLEGRRKLSARIAELIATEWAARRSVDN